MSILVAEAVAKSYNRRRVVNGVHVEIRGGEIIGLLGPNGAGKTTTFHMMVGLIQPDEGKVLLNNEDLTDAPIYERARAGISYLPQESSVFRRLSVTKSFCDFADPRPERRRATTAMSGAHEDARG